MQYGTRYARSWGRSGQLWPVMDPNRQPLHQIWPSFALQRVTLTQIWSLMGPHRGALRHIRPVKVITVHLRLLSRTSVGDTLFPSAMGKLEA